MRAVSATHHAAAFEMPGGDAGIPVRVPMLAKSAIRVSVLSRSGKPLAGAFVRFSCGSPSFGGSSSEARTDALGDAIFASLEIDPFGDQELLADHPDCLPEKRGFALQELVSLRGNPVVILRPGETLTGSVGAGAGSTSGYIVEAAPSDGQTGSPTSPSGFEYTPVRSADVGADGSFTLRGLAPGTLALRVRAGGEVLWENSAVFPAGPLRIDPEPVTIVVYACMPGERPAAGTRVFVRRRGVLFADAEHAGLTGPDGTFRMRGCAPGRYDGSVTFPDGVEKASTSNCSKARAKRASGSTADRFAHPTILRVSS